MMNSTCNSRRWLRNLASIIVLLAVVGSGAWVLTDDETAAETAFYDPTSALPGDILLHVSYDGANAAKNCRQLALAELWEEKQVQAFVAPMVSFMNGAVDEISEEMAEDIGLSMDDLSALGRSRTTITLVSVTPPNNAPPVVDVVATLDLGSNDEVVNRIQAAVERLLTEEAQAEIKMLDLGGVVARGCEVDQGLDFMWTAMGSQLVMGTQVKTMTEVLTRMKAKSTAGGLLENAAFTASRNKVSPNKEPVVFVHANVNGLIELMKSIEPDAAEQVDGFVQAFGLDQIRDYSYGVNFEGRAIVDRIWAATPKGQSGMLDNINHADAPLASMAMAPKDSLYYQAGRLDLSGVLHELMAFLEKVEPQGHEELAGMMDELDKQLGFSLLGDLLPNLGDEWGMWMGKAPYGSMIPEIIITAGVKDRAKVEGCIAGAKEKFGDDAIVRTFKFMDRDLHYCDMGQIFSKGEIGFGLKPCWMLEGQNMIVALAPQTLKNYIASRTNQRETLMANQDVSDAMAHLKRFNADVANCGFSFIDIASLVTMLADTAAPIAQSINLPREAMQGMDMDMNLFPTGDVFRRHFFGFSSATTVTDAGMLVEMHSPFGYAGMVMGVAVPVGLGTFMTQRGTSEIEVDWEELEPVELEAEEVKEEKKGSGGGK